eukprot:2009078-Prymnesium_polylepis.1
MKLDCAGTPSTPHRRGVTHVNRVILLEEMPNPSGGARLYEQHHNKDGAKHEHDEVDEADDSPPRHMPEDVAPTRGRQIVDTQHLGSTCRRVEGALVRRGAQLASKGHGHRHGRGAQRTVRYHQRCRPEHEAQGKRQREPHEADRTQ